MGNSFGLHIHKLAHFGIFYKPIVFNRLCAKINLTSHKNHDIIIIMENEKLPLANTKKDGEHNEPAPVMGASKLEFFRLELFTLKKIREALFILYKKKNWGFVPPSVKKADIILSKRITKVKRIIQKEQSSD